MGSNVATKAALPGATPTTSPTPALPGSGPGLPTSAAPAFWQDAGRITADVLELFARDPKRAEKVWAFARAELAKIKR